MRYHPPAAASGGLHLLVAVDPGGRQDDGRRCGVAAWLVPSAVEVAGGVLLGAGHVPLDEVGPWLARVVADVASAPVAWVVEKPHLRGDQHAQRRGVDALHRTLAILRGRRRRGSTWRAVRPHRWKGNVPKDTHHRRALRALVEAELHAARCLDPDGAAYQPDAADAIALGLWALGRTGRGGVHPSRGA